jgi:hypothetical protein
MDLSSDDFARAFGDGLKSFLDEQGISYANAAGLTCPVFLYQS